MPLKSQSFTSSGTFNVPASVSCVLVTAIGGGGAGAWSNGGFNGAPGGGSGGYCSRVPCPVTPGGTVTVTIGAGGLHAANGTTGETANGGDTSFGNVVVSGGRGGWWRDGAHMYGGDGGNAAGYAFTTGDLLERGVPPVTDGFISGASINSRRGLSPHSFSGGSSGGGGVNDAGTTGGASVNGFAGGANGGPATGGDTGSGGGSSPWGVAGAGGGHDQSGNSANAAHYGAAGGGGAGGGQVGGDGAPGYCLLDWMEP